MSAATRSEPECSASEMIAIEPDMMPTASLNAISVALDAIETPAARDLSEWFWRSSAFEGRSPDLDAFVPMQQTLPSQDIDEGPPGQCAVAGLVLGFLRPLGHGEV